MIQVTSVECARFLAKGERKNEVTRKSVKNNDDFQKMLETEICKLKEKEKGE